MHVVHLAAEASPYAKTGGLGDVLAALPRALASADVQVTVCLPGYREALRRAGETRPVAQVWAPVSSRTEPVTVLAAARAPVPTVFATAPRYFDRRGVYGEDGRDYGDNAERFVVFCRAALEWLRTCTPVPDVLHAHDWPAALAVAFLAAGRDVYPELAATRTVFTIHNLAYQGRFWAADWHLLNLDRALFTPEGLEFYGDIDFLKAGIAYADAVTTVSPRYATEIQTPAFGEGLDGLLRARADRLTGILNGVDYTEWSPAIDAALPARYDRGTLAGKTRCKAALQHELALTPRPAAPLLAVVSRFAAQKGIDLVVAVADDLLRTSDAQLAVLGSGDYSIEGALAALRDRFPGRVALRAGFDDGLAHRIEGGADMFLMPSRYEPCGLSQLYSLRYGTVPIVHATGGLDDTVEEWDAERATGTGFKFTPLAPDTFAAAIRRALGVFADPPRWTRLVDNGMQRDFSWDRSAARYRALYQNLLRED